TYAIVSYIYRWVITFSIIYTLSNFLKPLNMHTLSMMLALAALASMLGWPLYRMLKGIHQRGRLPDMKKNRVTATAVVVFLLVLAFFLLPLPISRVREKGMLDYEQAVSQKLSLPYPKGATLQAVLVEDGQKVTRGKPLMVFRSVDLENELDKMRE